MNSISAAWASGNEAQKRGFCNSLKNADPRVMIGVSRLLLDHQKREFFNFLEDSQKENFWNSLEDSQKKNVWSSLDICSKAHFLKDLSKNYTLAQLVFAVRDKVEKQLREEERFKKYNFKKVYIRLEDLQLKDGDPGAKKASISPKVTNYGEGKTLYLTIVYDTSGDIVAYDDKDHISRQCARFLVGHEIAHIVLHLDNLIESIMEEKEFPSECLEEEADLFATMISDLRDLYIAKHDGREDCLVDEKTAVDFYNKEVAYTDNMAKIILSLDENSESFTMSSYIFAAKKVISTVCSEDNHKISEIYSQIKSMANDKVNINCFRPDEKEDAINFGYSIVVPESANIETNSRDTTIGIGALLLDYDKIKNHPENLISIDNETFSMDKIGEFSECLLKARRGLIGNICENMKSLSRLRKTETVRSNCFS